MAHFIKTTNGRALINAQYVAKANFEGQYFKLYTQNLEVLGVVDRDAWLKYLESVRAEG